MVLRTVQVFPPSMEWNTEALVPHPPKKLEITISSGSAGFTAMLGSLPPPPPLARAGLVLLTMTSRRAGPFAIGARIRARGIASSGVAGRVGALWSAGLLLTSVPGGATLTAWAAGAANQPTANNSARTVAMENQKLRQNQDLRMTPPV